MIRVALDDGSFRDFPDGTSEADILGALQPVAPPPPAPNPSPLQHGLQTFVEGWATSGPRLLAGLEKIGLATVEGLKPILPTAAANAWDNYIRAKQESGDTRAQDLKLVESEWAPAPVTDPSLGHRVAGVAGGALSSLLPVFASYPLSGAAQLASLAIPAGFDEYTQARERGNSEGRSLVQGLVGGVAEAAWEKLNPLHRLRGAGSVLGEAAEELGTSATTDLSAAYLTGTDPTRGVSTKEQGLAFLNRLADAGLGGLIGGGAMQAVNTVQRNQVRGQLQDLEQQLVQRLTQNPADIEAATQLKQVHQGLAQLATPDELPASDPLKIARKVGFNDGDVEFVALPKGTVSGRDYVTEAPPTPEELRALRVSGIRSVNGTSIEDLAPVHAWANLTTGKVTVFNPNLPAAQLERELREEWMHLVLNRTEQGRVVLKEFFDTRPLTAPELGQLAAYTQREDETDDVYRLRLTDEFLAKLNKDTSWWRPRVQEFVALAKKTFGFNLTNAQAGRLVLRNLRRQGVTAYGQVQGQGTRQDEVVAGAGAGSATAQLPVRESIPDDLSGQVFYHGTRSSRFDRFSADAAAARSRTDLPAGMVAMTSNPDVAKTYARGRYGHVREVSLTPGAKVLRLDPRYTSNQSWRQIWIPNAWLKANLRVNAATESALGREWHRDERPGQETMVSVNELARAAAASGYDAILVPGIGDVSAPPPRVVERRGERIAQVAPSSQAVGDTVIVFDPTRVVFKDVATRPAIRTEDGTVIPAASPALAAEHAPLGQAVVEGTVDAKGEFREAGAADIRESLADEEYLSAVQRGDLETASRLEAGAAKAAGYTERVFHGSDEYRNAFDGGAFFTDSARDASAYAEMRALKQAVESNDALAEIVGEVMSEEGAEELTDLSPDTVRSIAEANGIALPDVEGYTFSGWLKPGRLLDLTGLGSEGRPKDLWESLHDRGLVSESWANLDADAKQELRSLFDGQAAYRLFEAEGVYAKAFELGYDTVKFLDQSPSGRSVHTSWLTRSPGQFKLAGPTRDDAGNVIPLSKRFNAESPDIRESLSAEEDAKYLAAVAAGDLATAQRMVDEAAVRTIRALPKLSVGDTSDGREVAFGVPNTGSISASLDSWESFGVRDVPMSWFNVRAGREPGLAGAIRTSGKIRPLIVVVDGSRDGLAYVLEGAHRVDALATLSAASFPALVVYDESADPVTRDDAGNVIPLSKRFNPATPDIRESLADFSQSKVRNPDGSLKVLYHGTRDEDALRDGITLFRADRREPGPHFGSRDQAKKFSSPDGQDYPVYLNIRNPLRTPDMWPLSSGLPLSMRWRTLDMLQEMVQDRRALVQLEMALEGLHDGPSLRDELLKLGYDGIVYDNVREGGGDSWIAFRPESQVKSALGNTGAYDITKPDIRESLPDFVDSVYVGSGSKELYHGSAKAGVTVHLGQVFADNAETAGNYGTRSTLSGRVDLSGLVVARVRPFDRDDANYGAIGDREEDLDALRDQGVDLAVYEDEDPYNRQHTAYRVVSEKALARVRSAVAGVDTVRESISEVDTNTLAHQLGVQIVLGDRTVAEPGKVTVDRNTARGDLRDTVILAQAEANILQLPPRFVDEVLAPYARRLDPQAGTDVKAWFTARAQNWQKRSLIRKTLDWWRFKLPTDRVRLEKAFGRLLDTVLSDPEFKVQYDPASPRQAFANQNADVLSVVRPIIRELRARAAKRDELDSWNADRTKARQVLEKARDDFFARGGSRDNLPSLTDDQFLFAIGRDNDRQLVAAHERLQYVTQVEKTAGQLETLARLGESWATFNEAQASPAAVGPAAAGAATSFRDDLANRQQELAGKIDWDFAPAARKYLALTEAQLDARAAKATLSSNEDVATWVEMVDLATENGVDLTPDPTAIPQTTRDNAVIDFFARKQALRDVSEEEQVRLGDKVRTKLAELKARLKERALTKAEKEFAADAYIKAAAGEAGESGRIEDRDTANRIRALSAQAAEFAAQWAESVSATMTVEELEQELASGTNRPQFNLAPDVLQQIMDLLRVSPNFRNAVVALRDAASNRFRNDPLSIIEKLEETPEEDRPAILASALRRIQKSIRMHADAMSELRGEIHALGLELAQLDTVSSLFPSSPEILDALRARRDALKNDQDVAEIEARIATLRNLRDLQEDSRTAVARMVYPSHDGWVFKDPMGGPDLVISPTKQHSKATLAQVQDWLANVERFWPSVPEHVRKGLVVGSRVASIFLHENFTAEELRKSLIPSSLLEGFSKLPISFKAILPTLVPGLWGGLLQDRLRALEDAQSAKNGVEARWMEPLHQALIRATDSLDLDRANVDHVRQFNALRNETLHRLRIFGSGVEVGDKLWSVPGKTITPELLTLARLDHRIGRDARAADAKRPYAGIRITTRRGQQLVRPSGETGDVGVARLANSDVLRAFVDGYRNPDPVSRQAWWSTADAQNGLRFHFFDADRTDTLIKREGTRDREVDLKRKIVRGEVRLTDLVTVEDWARASGIPVEDLMKELEQYYEQAKARLNDQSREPITNSGVFASETDRNEFTSPAAKLAFPSSWYDYGATRGLKAFLNRTVDTAEVEYLQALTDARDHLRLLSQRVTQKGASLEEMQWTLGTDRTEFTDADRKRAADVLSSREALLNAQRSAALASRVRPPMDGFLRFMHRAGIAPMLATTGAWAQQIVSSGVTSYLSLVPLVGPIAAGVLTPFNMGLAVAHAFVDLAMEIGRTVVPSYVPPAETDAFLLANGIGVTYRKQFEAEREAMERGEGGSSKLGIAAARFGNVWDEGVRTLNRVLGTVRGDIQNNRFAVRVLVPQMILALKYATALSPEAKEYLAGLGVGNAEEVFQQLKSMPIHRFWTTEAGRALALKVVRDYNAVSPGNRPDAGPYFTLLGWPSFVLGSVLKSMRRTPDQSRFRHLKPMVVIASVAILSDIARLAALDETKEAFRKLAQRLLEALPDDDDDEEGWWESLLVLLGMYRLLRAGAAAHASAPPLQPWDKGYFERPLLEVVSGLAKNAAGGIGINTGGVSLPIWSIGSNAVSGAVQMGRGLVDTGITDVKGGARKALGMAGLYGRMLGEFLFPGGRAGFEANAELVGIAHQEGIPVVTRAFDPGFLSATPFRREMLALGERLAAGDETALPALEDVRKRVEDRARDRALRQGKTENEADDAAESAIRSMVTSLDPYRNALGRSLTEQEYEKLRSRASDRVRRTERARDAVVKGLKLRPTRGMVSPLRKRKGLGKPKRVRL